MIPLRLSHWAKHVAVVAAIGLSVALVTWGAVAGMARANGVPVMVTLSYIDLSNWGPQDASGEAELIFAEGIVRLEAQGLPMLPGSSGGSSGGRGEGVYQAWLVNSEAGDAISVGRFNASSTGTVSYEGTLPPIADFGFDLLILTVEPDPDDAPQPTERRSIGGYFTLIGQTSSDGSLEGSQGLQAPGSLPNTGAPGWTSDVIRFSALMGAMALSVVVGLRLSRRSA
ncbi:MAG: hypothetical protein M0R73_05765 [Dehalococcoidia bacterium]|nr:hypothetical protein [Dehalococcoidia bacterium]